MERGTIKYFSRSKGHGFVNCDQPGEDLFVHITEYVSCLFYMVERFISMVLLLYDDDDEKYYQILYCMVFFCSIEGEYVPREGDEVTFRRCPLPPKFEKFQVIVNV